MKVTQTQLEELLEMVALDQSIDSKRSQLEKLASSAELTELRAQLSKASNDLLEASKNEEAVNLELERNNADLSLVEQREARDKQRLVEATNTKDVQGLQSELATLARRRSELEDASLALMEAQSEAAAAVEAATKAREELRQLGEQLNQKIDAETMKLRSAIELDAQQRAKVAAQLAPELISTYDRKRAKGTAVARLSGPECGGCRMTISSAEYAALTAKPLDELIECPECSAILVRV